MSADLIYPHDWKSKSKSYTKIEGSKEQSLEAQAIAIANMASPSVFGFVDPPCEYLAPTQDPA